MSLLEIARRDGRFTILLTLIEKSGLLDTLSKSKNLTIFAPTDQAFGLINGEILEKLQLPSNLDILKKVLLYHILKMPVHEKDIFGTATPVTMEGKNLCIFKAGPVGKQSIYVNDAEVILGDIESNNGVIHVIDRVLNPLDSCTHCLEKCEKDKEGYRPVSPRRIPSSHSPRSQSGSR